MAKNTQPFFYKEDKRTLTFFETADSTNFKQIAVAGADGSHVFEILIASTDTVARQIEFWAAPTATAANAATEGFPLKVSVAIAIGLGTLTAQPDALKLINFSANFINERLLDRDQNYYIALPAGYYLYARQSLGAVTAATKVSVCVIQKDF